MRRRGSTPSPVALRPERGHLDQELPFGVVKAGLWAEHADTGPRARYDYDSTASTSIRRCSISRAPGRSCASPRTLTIPTLA